MTDIPTPIEAYKNELENRSGSKLPYFIEMVAKGLKKGQRSFRCVDGNLYYLFGVTLQACWVPEIQNVFLEKGWRVVYHNWVVWHWITLESI